MSEVSNYLDVDRGIVKAIIHPSLKGMTENHILQKIRVNYPHLDQSDIRRVRNYFFAEYPRLKRRNKAVEEYLVKHKGVLPPTKLGRCVYSYDPTRYYTKGVSDIDQVHGSEMTKAWALECHYKFGHRWPVVFDLHDALGFFFSP